MKTVNDIRNEFLGYFKAQGHEVVPSSSLVPQNDPTLMFTNSGMVQFKDVFTGKEKRPYTRATTAQKCVRAGGKHNDLDNVGYTARHHTFFEMMGNFSFGDYFKEEAITYAWELISKGFAMPKDKLLVTVYHDDEQAVDLWKKIAGFSDEKIIRIKTNDNFWMMGDTGPCGPCSEIFYDQGEALAGGPPGSPEEDGDRFLEFWNLVFMQFEQEPDGNGGYTRTPLPKPSIDTGMGLERMSALMQGKTSNYGIDLLRDIIEHSATLTGVSPDGAQAASHRVIADHLRASAFLMADGVMPSNEGRGYVLRRIMRRGMRHAHLLGAKEPLLHQLFPTLLGKMGGAYPELGRAGAMIVQTLKSEEERFKVTLERGLKMLEQESAGLSAGEKFSGETAFKLYDTYGFPLDLTQDALKAKNIAVDVSTFETCMAEQKKKARSAWAGSGDTGTEKLWFDILDEVGPTEFLGYDFEHADGQIKAIVKKQYRHPVGASEGRLHERDPEHASGKAAHDSGSPQFERAEARRGDDAFDWAQVETLKAGEEGIIITNQTPFYAESGGQVGDSGVLTTPDESQALVTDVKKQLGALYLHHVKILSSPHPTPLPKGERGQDSSQTAPSPLWGEGWGEGTVKENIFSLQVGDTVQMNVNHARRSAIRANHSATHLLHEALRQVLGDHVAQKGSLQDSERTRFDISQPVPVTPAQITAVETLVNAEIQANTPVETLVLPIEEARATGAMALFGEKYDEEVRVVSMGQKPAGAKKAFSVELCGGTHVKSTGEIGQFKIISEGSLSAGVRRLEAITGARVEAYLSHQKQKHQDNIERLRTEISQLEQDYKELSGHAFLIDSKDDDEEGLGYHIKVLKKSIADLGRAQATQSVGGAEEAQDVGGVKFIGKVLGQEVSAKDLKPMVDDLKQKLGSGVIVLVATNEDKASIVVGVTSDLTATINAVDLVKIGAQALGGQGGGGRPDMAQAGGPNAGAAEDALSAVKQKLAS